MFNPRSLCLHRIGGGSHSKTIIFNDEVTIVGRHESCNVRILGPHARSVSRKHCKISFENGKMYVENISETTDTYLNEDKVLQKTEVEKGDLVGLGTRTILNTNEPPSEERFIYKCCEIPTVVIDSSDDEQEEVVEDNNNNNIQDVPSVIVLSNERINPISSITPKEAINGNLLASVQRPAYISSPGFSSDASTSTDNGTRALINNIVTSKFLTQSPERIQKPKKCYVKVKNLTREEIDQLIHKEKVQSSTSSVSNDSIKINKTTMSEISKISTTSKKRNFSMESSKSTSSSSTLDKRIKGSKHKKVEQPKKKIPITFSRSKYEKEKLAKQINKKLNRLVDSESDEESRKAKNKTGRSNVIEKDYTIKLKAPQQSDKKYVQDKPSTANTASSSKTATTSEKKLIPVYRRKTIDHRENAIVEKAESRRKTVDGNANVDHTSKSNKTNSTKPVNETQKAKNEQTTNHRSNNKRPRDPQEETDQTEKTSKFARNTSKQKSPSPKPSTSAKLDIYDFPSLQDAENNFPFSSFSRRRHQSMFIDRRESLERPKSSNHDELPRIQCIMKKNQELRKRIRSVGERQNQNPNRPKITEDQKQKLRDIAIINKQTQAEEQIKQTDRAIDDSTKLQKGSTVKVKITNENRGNFLTQEIPKPKNVKNKVKNDASPQKKSLLDQFREKHVKKPLCSMNGVFPELNDRNDVEDPLINLDIPVPTRDIYNQPTTSVNQVPTTLADHAPLPGIYTEIVTSSQAAQVTLEPFPTVPLASMDAPTVIQTNIKINLKSILKTANSRGVIPKKKVTFEISAKGCERTPSQTNIQTTKILKDIEDYKTSIIEEVLGWDTNWLKTLPEKWPNVPMKSKYENLDEYKGIIKSLIRIELLSKLKNSCREKSQRALVGKEYIPLGVKVKSQHGKRHRLELCQSGPSKSEQPLSFYKGLLVILRIKDVNKKEIDFFGYVYEVKATDQSTIVHVDTVCSEMPANLAAVKCKSLMYIRNDINSMVAIENIQEVPIIANFLNPELNSLTSDWSTALKITNDFNNDQKKILNMITTECLSNRRKANIIALHSKAGTGKTKVLIESIVNIIYCSKRDTGAKCSILVCTMSNVLIDQIAVQVKKQIEVHKNAKLARTGDRAKMTDEAKALHVNEDKSLKDYDVIFTTVTHAYDLYNYKKDFDVCFIDDANCCIDSELAILLQLNITKLFLIGDNMQTQPMAQSEELLDSNYDETFFSRMIATFKNKPDERKPILQLTSQHRMNNELSEFVDKCIYENISQQQLQRRTESTKLRPFLVMSLCILGNEHPKFRSVVPDSNILPEFLENLIDNVKEVAPKMTVGIIVKTTREKQLIEDQNKSLMNKAQLFTVDRIMGVEKDIVIIACLDKSDIIYMSSLNRMNKAITRARHAVYVVGISNFYQQDIPDCRLWSNIVQYTKENQCIETITKINDRIRVRTIITCKDQENEEEKW